MAVADQEVKDDSSECLLAQAMNPSSPKITPELEEQIVLYMHLNDIAQKYSQKQKNFLKLDNAIYCQGPAKNCFSIIFQTHSAVWYQFFNLPELLEFNINRDMIIVLEQDWYTPDIETKYISGKRLLIRKKDKGLIDKIPFMCRYDFKHIEDDDVIFPFTVSLDGKHVFYLKISWDKKRKQLSWRKKEQDEWIKYKRFNLPLEDDFLDISYLQELQKIVLLKNDKSFKIISLTEQPTIQKNSFDSYFAQKGVCKLLKNQK